MESVPPRRKPSQSCHSSCYEKLPSLCFLCNRDRLSRKSSVLRFKHCISYCSTKYKLAEGDCYFCWKTSNNVVACRRYSWVL